MRHQLAASLVALAIGCGVTTANAQTQQDVPQDLTQLSIDDLMKVKVTTAGKRAQSLLVVPAAIYVVTSEDIRRSGAIRVPDVLRGIPGVQVAQISSSQWAISIRGFNGPYANKLLVLIDGRSIYSHVFGGVIWEDRDLPFEDIERIEVLRGPGGSLWGANAVNGIINIITKHSKDTQGIMLSGGAGDEERGFGSVRYGGTVGSDAAYRVYAKYMSRDPTLLPTGPAARDAWDSLLVGGRFDWNNTRAGRFMLEAGSARAMVGRSTTLPLLTPPYSQTITESAPSSSWHVLARWERTNGNGSETSAQVFYDQLQESNSTVWGLTKRFDVDLQYKMQPTGRHSLTFGAGYRHDADRLVGSEPIHFDPERASASLYSAFIQDNVELGRNMRLAIGTKLEHNSYTGMELQPNASLAWNPDAKRTLWASLSRAVRTPTRADRDLRRWSAAFPGQGGMTTLVELFGDPDYDAGDVVAHEIGYRVEASDRMTVDLAAFFNVYRGLGSVRSGQPFLEMSPAPPHVVVPTYQDTGQSGETYGIELGTNMRISDRWTLRAGYSLLHARLRLSTPGSVAIDSPADQLSLQSRIDLPGRLELDTSLFVAARHEGVAVPAYARLDARLGWRPSKGLEVSIIAQNLLNARHLEFGSAGGVVANQIERNVFMRATWRH